MRYDRAYVLGTAAVLAAMASGGVLLNGLGRGPGPVPSACVDRLGRQGAVDAACRLHGALTLHPFHLRQAEAYLEEFGSSRRWRVECVNEAGFVDDSYVLDAATGRLQFANARGWNELIGQPVRSQQQAAARAWYWMERLGIAAQSPEWRLHGHPCVVSGIWSVRFDSADRWACVHVDSSNGACWTAYTSDVCGVRAAVALHGA